MEQPGSNTGPASASPRAGPFLETAPSPEPRAAAGLSLHPRSVAADWLTWQVWQEWALCPVSLVPSSLFPVTRASPSHSQYSAALTPHVQPAMSPFVLQLIPVSVGLSMSSSSPIHDIWQKGELRSHKSCFALVGNLLTLFVTHFVCNLCLQESDNEGITRNLVSLFRETFINGAEQAPVNLGPTCVHTAHVLLAHGTH